MMIVMRKRRRLWRLLTAAALLVAALVAAMFVFAPPPSISVSFAAYAPVDMAAGPYPGDSPWRLVSIPCALTIVTNLDDAPVQVTLSVPDRVLEDIRVHHDITTRDSAKVFFASPQVVAPNSSLKVAVPLARAAGIWRADFQYHRVAPRGRLAAWLANAVPNPTEKWLRRLESNPSARSLRIGPYTNTTPSAPNL